MAGRGRQQSAAHSRRKASRARSDPAPRHGSRLDARSLRIGLAVCVLLAAVVHGRSLTFEFTRTDDKVLLLDDEAFIRDAANIPRAFFRPFFPSAPRGETYYRPLVTTSFILDAQWKGVRPFAYHVTNVVLHVVATALFFVLLGRLGFGWAESIVGASLFAVHPALTEAVAWIPGRCDLLLGVGFLLSTLFRRGRFLFG